MLSINPALAQNSWTGKYRFHVKAKSRHLNFYFFFFLFGKVNWSKHATLGIKTKIGESSHSSNGDWFKHLSVKLWTSPRLLRRFCCTGEALLSVGVPPCSLWLRRFLLCGRVSQCFSLHSWRTCIILNPVETDCTQPGVVDVAMWGQGLLFWEHGTWYVKWLVSKLTLALPRQPVKLPSYML